MNPDKSNYLAEIRANTAYPTYRGIIGLLVILGYILAGLYGISALIGGLMTMGDTFLGGLAFLVIGLVFAGFIALLTKLGKEVALVIVDFGDSTLDANSKK